MVPDFLGDHGLVLGCVGGFFLVILVVSGVLVSGCELDFGQYDFDNFVFQLFGQSCSVFFMEGREEGQAQKK